MIATGRDRTALIVAGEKGRFTVLSLLAELGVERSKTSVFERVEDANAYISSLQSEPDVAVFDVSENNYAELRALAEVLSARDTGVLFLSEDDGEALQRAGVFAVKKPAEHGFILAALRVLFAMREKLRERKRESIALRSKIDEVRIVNRAKWILIDRFKMDESAAHKYIEKQAMDTRASRREVAENIVTTYED